MRNTAALVIIKLFLVYKVYISCTLVCYSADTVMICVKNNEVRLHVFDVSSALFYTNLLFRIHDGQRTKTSGLSVVFCSAMKTIKVRDSFDGDGRY